MIFSRIISSLLAVLVFSNILLATDQYEQPTPVVSKQHSVGCMQDAVDLIFNTYGTSGVAIAFDFDDTLFAKELELKNGKRLRYLEKSSFSDFALNGGFHPIFQIANENLGLNLVETNRSFRSIRKQIMGQSEESPLMSKEAHYYSVEEEEGFEILKAHIEQLRSTGSLLCIVTAEAGQLNPLKLDLAKELGFAKEHFLRGHKKFENIVEFLQTQSQICSHLTTPIHTLILIDDTPEYLQAWTKHASNIQLQEMSFIQPFEETGEFKIVAIHYDYLNQHQKLVSQKMIAEFKGIYGTDYSKNPQLKPFLKGKEKDNCKIC